MRQAIGSTALYNIIIIFIVITFAFLTATLSYMKAFKLNGRIAKSLEKFEGYNILSANEIETTLSNLGYRVNDTGNASCSNRKHRGKNYVPITTVSTNIGNTKYKYCVYEYPKENSYFIYGIVTYIYMDIPLIGGTFSLPVYSETERIYEFNQK